MTAARVTRRERSPQTKGPRKNDPTSPHEIETMETIVAGRKYARMMDRTMKRALSILINPVRVRSVSSALMNPA